MNTSTNTKNVAVYITAIFLLANPYIYARFPNPPAPIHPAIAVYPTNEMPITVTLEISAGFASGNKTFVIIWKWLAPIALLASIVPLSTSFKAIIHIRA